MAAADGEFAGRDASADVADHARREDDRGKRHVEREDRDERRRGDHPQRRRFSAREPMRHAACSTMATTAGLMP